MKVESHDLCKRCVMPRSALGFVETHGGCNFCESAEAETKSGSLKRFGWEQVEDLRSRSKANWDCVMGVSGGVDSSYAVLKAVEKGFRPLLVHMDNSWNSETAAANISRLVASFNLDLVTYVLDWPSYRMSMQALLNADVVDIELLYDNAMRATVYSVASKLKIPLVLSGSNTNTEGVIFPENWNWFKLDKTNLKSIIGRKTLANLPTIGVVEYASKTILYGIRWVPFLDLFEYKKDRAISELVDSFGYKPYPYKHYENVFTRFYQGFLLPEKFGIDKRSIHFSSLVVAGQMRREDALAELNTSAYPSDFELERDKRFFLKKMNWQQEDLQQYIDRPPRDHSEFRSSEVLRMLKR